MTEFTKWRSLVDGEEISAIPDSVLDNFEPADGDPAGPYDDGDNLETYYTIHTGDFERSDSDPIKDDFSLSRTETAGGDGSFIISRPGDGLPTYPDPGESVSAIIDGQDQFPGLIAGCPDTDQVDGYALLIRDGDIRFRRYDNGSATTLATSSDSISDFPVEGVVKPPGEGDDNVQASVYELDDNLERDGQVVSFDETDDTYDGERGFGGLCGSGADTGVFADEFRHGRSI